MAEGGRRTRRGRGRKRDEAGGFRVLGSAVAAAAAVVAAALFFQDWKYPAVDAPLLLLLPLLPSLALLALPQNH